MQAAGQAAGTAIGAAIGTYVGGPVGGVVGAQIGSSAVGSIQSFTAGDTQTEIEEAALETNRAQARESAAERSAVLAGKFRKALATQVSIASMRGGSGSLALQFGRESMENYLADKDAIARGLQISETQSKIAEAEIDANANARHLKALSNFTTSAFSSINFSNLLKGTGGGKGGGTTSGGGK